MLSIGARMAACVLGVIGGSVALVMAVVLILFGGVLSIVSSGSHASVAASGGLLCLFSLVALAAAAAFVLIPWSRLPAVITALDIAAMFWAMARIDAAGLSLVPIVPLCFAVLLGLAAEPRATRQDALMAES
jgi:hypothetical protein